MEKTINKVKEILELLDQQSIDEIYGALEKVLPTGQTTPRTKVRVKVGWAVGNESDPGNHCNIIIKVDN
jgi:hypothetical protein